MRLMQDCNHLKSTQSHSAKEANEWICDLSTYGLLQISGMDAKTLLQGQLTCDVSM